MAESKLRKVKLRARTYTESDADGWWCCLELSNWLSSEPEDTAAVAPPIRIGPFPSRQAARRELRGDFRRACVDVMQEYARDHGGTFERFIVGGGG